MGVNTSLRTDDRGDGSEPVGAGSRRMLPVLRYGGSAHSFGFAIYSAVRARYEDAVLLTGSPVGTPQEALDTACTVLLAGLGHEPPTN
jgi:hypothetical protein